ncbi:transposase [bacterium]|nr:transposase [bacterium]
MARGPRVTFPHAVFHVINRFVDRHPFFRKDCDYRYFLDVYFEEARTFGIWSYAYDLLPNHFHVVLETPSGEISKFLQRWLTRAAQSMNRRYGRVGHLFQGRTKTLIVQTDRYFGTLMGYTLLNRVRAGLARNVFSDRWNSVKEMLSLGDSRLARGPLWEYLFGHPFDDRYVKQHVAKCRGWLESLDVTSNKIEFQEGHQGGFLSSPEYRRRILDRVERRRGDWETDSRRKTDRHRIRWTWDKIRKSAERAVSKFGHVGGGWQSRDAAVRQIRSYVAHVGGGWTWHQISQAEAKEGRRGSSQAMAVSRMRSLPNKLKVADHAIRIAISE